MHNAWLQKVCTICTPGAADNPAPRSRRYEMPRNWQTLNVTRTKNPPQKNTGLTTICARNRGEFTLPTASPQPIRCRVRLCGARTPELSMASERRRSVQNFHDIDDPSKQPPKRRKHTKFRAYAKCASIPAASLWDAMLQCGCRCRQPSPVELAHLDVMLRPSLCILCGHQDRHLCCDRRQTRSWRPSRLRNTS